MATAQSVSTFAAALKTLYPNKAIEDLCYPTNVLLALVKKTEDFYGENMVIPVHVDDISGLNQSFTRAQSDGAGSQKKKFTVTRKSEYGVASISNELIEASASSAGSFVQGLKSEMDAAFRGVGKRIGSALYRDGSGQLSTIGSTTVVASTSLVLGNASDVTNFYVNQYIVFAANSASALRSATPRKITAIDDDTGTLTLDANVNAASTAIVTTDAIFTYGDYAAANNKNRIAGLAAWCPSSAPGTADSFFGLNRSSYPTRLAGHRITGTGMQMDEAIYKAATRIARCGGKPDVVLMSHENYEVLQNTLASKVCYDQMSNGQIAFDAIKIMGPAGSLKIVPDFNCPADILWVAELDALELASLNKAPHILGLDGGDGMRLLRASSADEYELRVGAYMNFCVRRPFHLARVSVTAPA